MKKTLSLILAVMMLLGCFGITAFAEETDNTTDISLTVAKELSYDMVIPEDVSLDSFGVFEVGQAKVKDVKNATENTVISYTAETTNFKCDGKSDIPASYYTDAEGSTAFPTEAVEVYKNKADAASIPTMYVGISENDFNAAENGTYTATVTFNFSAEDVEAPVAVTAADALVTGAQFMVNVLTSGGSSNHIIIAEKTTDGFALVSYIVDGEDQTEMRRNEFKCSSESGKITILDAIDRDIAIINTNNNTFEATSYPFGTFAVKPAGATEFTEVILAQAQPE